jgi:RES domain-containing protein
VNSLWRISVFRDLTGMGGEFSEGRWHVAAPGKRILYCTEHPALALIESVVNLRGDRTNLPDSYQLLRLEVTPDLSTETLSEEALPTGWREDLAFTRLAGDEWLERGESALLAVPSAPSPESLNYLLNPRHPDAAGVSVAWSKWLRYDRRLFRLSE